MANKTKAELARDLTSTNAELARARAELETLKTNVVEVALRAQRDEGWCDSGLRSALQELGLKAPSKNKTATLHFQVDVFVNAENADSDYTGRYDRLLESLDLSVDRVIFNDFNGFDGERFVIGEIVGFDITDINDADDE